MFDDAFKTNKSVQFKDAIASVTASYDDLKDLYWDITDFIANIASFDDEADILKIEKAQASWGGIGTVGIDDEFDILSIVEKHLRKYNGAKIIQTFLNYFNPAIRTFEMVKVVKWSKLREEDFDLQQENIMTPILDYYSRIGNFLNDFIKLKYPEKE